MKIKIHKKVSDDKFLLIGDIRNEFATTLNALEIIGAAGCGEFSVMFFGDDDECYKKTIIERKFNSDFEIIVYKNEIINRAKERLGK